MAWSLGAAMLSACTCAPQPAADDPVPAAPEPTEATPPTPAASEGPNVLIVVWDTVRADRMSLYGHDRPTTPKLEAFAEEATVYEQATAPGMWTLPSHASMFTGLRGTTHGATASWRWLDHRFETLAETLGQAGYQSIALSSNLIASPMTNLTQGFDVVRTTFPQNNPRAVPKAFTDAAKKATQSKLVARDASTEISPAFGGQQDDKWGKSVFKDAAPVMHAELMRFLDQRRQQGPWFAYINMMEAHSPRIPSMSARQRLLTDEQIELGLTTDASLFALNEYIVGKRDYTPEELEAIAGVYDASILDLDDATGALFDDLEQRGVLDDTLVIVVADHGEALGEHQRFEHRWSVFEQLLHVPLVVRYPKRFEPGRVEQRVSTADVYATVLDVAGVAPPAELETSRSLAGRATFEPFVFTQMLDPFASQLASMKKAYPDLDTSPWERTYCAVYEGAHKLIHASDGHHMLFDVGADPAESHDLIETEAERAARLTEALGAWEAELVTYDPSQRTPRDGARGQKGKAKGAAKGAEMSPEECEQLKMLGYVSGDCNEQQPDLSRARCGPGAG
jgi:arylsulfatase A-like enzyme